jgi:hypothetical protein
VRAVATNETGPGHHAEVVAADGETLGAAAARGVAATSGDLVCILAASTEPLEDGWLLRLAAVVEDDVAASGPLVLHPERPLRHATPHDLSVRAAGFEIVSTADGVPVAQARESGTDPRLHREPVDVASGTSACLVVQRIAYDEVGGLAAIDDLDAAVVDLCARLRERGRRVVAVPSSVVTDHRLVRSRRALRTPVGEGSPGWQTVVDRHGPALRRAAAPERPGRLRFAITSAAPSAKVAPRWGDWHFGNDLARALERLGHAVIVQTADRADDLAGRSCDVHIVLRGLARARRTPGQAHILWIISHPESVDVSECDDADLVLVASSRFAAYLRTRTTTPVEVFLQATDHQRFKPGPSQPRYEHPVAVVAKTRDVMRPIVADAIACGIRPAIYGSGWERFVDPELVVSDYVANDDLPALYASIGVLLNDHWEEMQRWGFVSNRILDALACGTPVLSDHMSEIRELLHDTVPTYRARDELRALVDADLVDPEAARLRAGRGRAIVLGAHTFEQRARELLALLRKHRIDDVFT